MAPKIVWSPEAVDDIDSIFKYISKDSQAYANSVISRIINCAENVIDFPEAGRVVPELNTQSIREKFVYSYRIIYKIEDFGIRVLTIIHGKRLLDKTIL